jgi:hypothetical protein
MRAYKIRATSAPDTNPATWQQPIKQTQRSTSADALTSLMMEPQQRCTVEEQQLFQLLGLLQVHEAASRHGVELTPTCFRKPNAKGLELVLYRAYALIHGEARAAKVRRLSEEAGQIMYCPSIALTACCTQAPCIQDFRNIWPVVDRVQSKEFNQV